jgi:methylglyoxal synthase
MREVFIDNVLSADGLAVLVKRVRNSGRLRIATIASESCKDLLAKFVLDNREFFRQHDLFSTSGTSTTIRSHADIEIESVGHGPDGGDVILAHKILRREIDVVIFFRSGHELYPHESDIRTLLRIGDMSNCVVATNVATAALVVGALAYLASNESIMAHSKRPAVGRI